MTLHSSINTLPIGAFMAIMDTGNLFLLRISGKPKLADLQAAWDKIMDEYIAAFGIPDGYAEYLAAMARAAQIWNAIYNKGQRWRKPEALMAEAEARQHMGAESEGINTMIARVSRFMGFRVNPNAVTVAEFYQYLEEMRHG